MGCLYLKHRKRQLQAFCVCLLLIGNVAAVEDRVSVVFPEVKSAYSKVFDDITKGVEEGFTGQVKEISVSSNNNADYVLQKLGKQNPDAVIALGGSSLKIIKSLQPEVPILAGAIIRNGGSVSGISMIPNGSSLMSIMLELKPDVKTVYVVDGKRSLGGIVESSKGFLHSKGIDFYIFEAGSLQEGAKSYQDIIAHVNEGDAIWIMPGAPYLDSSVFSLLLEVAWKKNLVMFSSNPSHASRGALFSVYPDNHGMGRTLGIMASNAISGDVATDLVAVEDLYVGVNQRTAKHLGINIQAIDLGETKKVIVTQ